MKQFFTKGLMCTLSLIFANIALAQENAMEDRTIDGFTYQCIKGKNFCIYKRRWLLVLDDKTVHSLMDLNSIGDTSVWMLSNYPGANFSALNLYDINCQRHRYSEVSTYIYDKYDAAGNIKHSYKTNKEKWEKPIPDTTMDFVINAICKNRE